MNINKKLLKMYKVGDIMLLSEFLDKNIENKEENKENKKKTVNNLMFYKDYKNFYDLAYTLRKSKTDTINFLMENFIKTYREDIKQINELYNKILHDDEINQVKVSMFVDIKLYDKLLEIEEFEKWSRVHTLSLAVNLFVNQNAWLIILEDPKFKKNSSEKFIKFYYKNK